MPDHKADAVNTGPLGWVPTIDGRCHGNISYRVRSEALSAAEQAVDDLKLQAMIRRVAGEPPKLRVIDGGHDLQRERMERGIGGPADEFGSW